VSKDAVAKAGDHPIPQLPQGPWHKSHQTPQEPPGRGKQPEGCGKRIRASVEPLSRRQGVSEQHDAVGQRPNVATSKNLAAKRAFERRVAKLLLPVVFEQELNYTVAQRTDAVVEQ